MNFDDYQNQSRVTARYPEPLEEFGLSGIDSVTQGLTYVSLGLAGEAAEFGQKVSKLMRDADCDINDEARAALGKELGDVLWFAAQAATELGLSLGDIAQQNIDKLRSRMERGVLHGSGDQR